MRGFIASIGMYTEIMRRIDGMGGIKISGTVIINIRKADDTEIIAESESQQQQLMDTVVEGSEVKGLFLNGMVFSMSDVISTCKLTIHGNSVDHADRFASCNSDNVRWQMRTKRTTENNHCKISIHLIGKSYQE